MSSLYDEVGGFDASLALCRRWHTLCLADPVGAPVPDDLPFNYAPRS